MDRRFNQPNRASYYDPNYNYNSNYNYENGNPPPNRLYPEFEQARGEQEEEREEGEGQGQGQRKGKEGMMAWMQRISGSKEFQFGATALVSGAVVASAILGYQHVRRQERVEDLKSSIPALGQGHQADKLTDYGAASPHNGILSKEDERSAELARRAQNGDYDDDLILEQLARNRVFLTDQGLSKLRNAFIIVVGCGGVGSHCTSTLARSGVSRIRLIDFDQVTLSSLNRHAVATLADVGTPKVTCLRRHLQQITPWVHFDLRNELFAPSAAESLLGPWRGEGEERKPDFVVDAIDNIDSKVTKLTADYLR